MFPYISSPQKLLQWSLGGFCVLQKYGIFTRASTACNTKVYDIATYEFPYNAEEKNKLLEILNYSSEEQLCSYGIGKGKVNKLIKARSRLNSFHNLSQLLDVGGFGLKAVEDVCNNVLKNYQNPVEDPNLNKLMKKTSKFKKFVKPELTSEDVKGMEKLLALKITVRNVSWTLLDGNGAVADMGYEELLSNDQRYDASKLYNVVKCAVDSLPMADVYVQEEETYGGQLHRAPFGTISYALKFAQMEGMFTALLKVRQGWEQEGMCYCLKTDLVSRLFNLKVGKERVSGLDIADQIMENKYDSESLKWLPPLCMSDEVSAKYFSFRNLEKIYIYPSLLVGLAFYQTFIKNLERT